MARRNRVDSARGRSGSGGIGHSPLIEALRTLTPTGPNGFEGLIRQLLEHLTGYPLYLARSGDQDGRDLRSGSPNCAVIAAECKRYGKAREFAQNELIGELANAATTIPELDTWILVASRAVPDQLYSAVERNARDRHVEFYVISPADGIPTDGVPSRLEILCASAPGIIREFLSRRRSTPVDVDAVDREMLRIRALSGYANACTKLASDLARSAKYEWWRRDGHRRFLDALKSPEASRAAFGQLLDVGAKVAAGRLVTRSEASRKLQQWYDGWGASHKPFAVLGDEGDGKTWAVASWLRQRCQDDPQFPPVLWLSAYQVTKTDPRSAVADALAALLKGPSDYWTGRVGRWLQRQSGSIPACVLILDGLNERQSRDFWRQLLEGLAAPEWASFAAVLMTTRAGNWAYFKALPHLQISDYVLEPFSDAEFQQALDMAGLQVGEIPNEVVALARKPRYFDLVVRHRDRLMLDGDVTIARLIYEDWRDRFDRKPLPVNEPEFHDMLRALASRARNDEPTFSENDVAELLPFTSDRAATLSELETGGILLPEGGRLRVEPKRLQLGFGLLLADRLRNAIPSAGPERIREIVAELVEGLPDTEIRTGICESAALHALWTPGFSLDVRAILLVSWLRSRNREADLSKQVAAYFPLDPDAYFAAAERLWTDVEDDPSAQQELMKTFARWSKIPKHLLRFVPTFEKWLGLVHVESISDDADALGRRTREQVAVRLGREPTAGPLAFGDFTLTIVEDAGVARLGRMALAIISELDRGPFVRALAIGALAEAVMPERYDILAWVIRSTPRDVSTDIFVHAEALASIGNQTANRAAYHLLTFAGSSESIALRRRLPEGLLPRNRAWERLERDPCRSGFPWTREACSSCASHGDIDIFHVARQLARFCPEEGFEIPETARERLIAAASIFDVSAIHTGPVYVGEPDVRLDELDPALAAFAPKAAADLYRRVAREARARTGRGLQLLLFFLEEHVLILGDAERAVLLDRWEQSRNTPRVQDRTERLNGAFLVKLLFAGMGGREQLAMLLARRPEDLMLVALDRWILQVDDDELQTALASSVGDAHRLRRLLHFAAAQPNAVSPLLASRISSFATDPDDSSRAAALQTVLRTGDELAAHSVIRAGWQWSRGGHAEENLFGSLLLEEFGHELSYDELRQRIDPALLGVALAHRGHRPTEVEQLALEIDDTWRTVLRHAHDLPADFPPTEIHIDRLSSIDRLERIGLGDSVSSENIRIRARSSTWGGTADRILDRDFHGGGDDPIDRRLEKSKQIFKAGLEQQRGDGNIWFANRFSTSGLAAVCAARPDLLDSWLAPILTPDHPDHVRAVSLIRNFYEALCFVLLEAEPHLGVRLYVALRDEREITAVRVGLAGLHHLDVALFGATESGPTVTAWQTRLDRARCDGDLLAISVLAQRGAASAWLKHIVVRDLASARPLEVARALALCGFVDTPWAAEVLAQSARPGDETWYGQVARTALERQIRDRAAQYRFRRFMHEPDSDHAWAGFRLLLRVVDRRIALWHERHQQEAVDSRRLTFLTSSSDRIAKAIEKNEDQFRKEFLGQQVREGQCWPWIDG